MPESRGLPADQFKALGDWRRCEIIVRLEAGRASTTQLANLFEMSLTAVNHHLRILEQAGITRSEKIDRTRYHYLIPSGLQATRRWLDGRAL